MFFGNSSLLSVQAVVESSKTWKVMILSSDIICLVEHIFVVFYGQNVQKPNGTQPGFENNGKSISAFRMASSRACLFPF